MSDEFIALVITIPLIVLIVAWMPFLNLIWRPCARFLQLRRLQKDAREKASKPLRPQRPSARRIGWGLDLDS